MLLYNGIHYDALALSPYYGAPEEEDITIFPSDDDSILTQALLIAEIAYQVIFSYILTSLFRSLTLLFRLITTLI
jgi:hypothetical protein